MTVVSGQNLGAYRDAASFSGVLSCAEGCSPRAYRLTRRASAAS
jgi:hypothetical protein